MGSPVAASQTTVVPRWFVTPTPATGPASARELRATSSRALAKTAAVQLDQPRHRALAGTGLNCRRAVDGAVGADDARPLTALLPTSMTRMLMGAPSGAGRTRLDRRTRGSAGGR